jgi:hypothetical protein
MAAIRNNPMYQNARQFIDPMEHAMYCNAQREVGCSFKDFIRVSRMLRGAGRRQRFLLRWHYSAQRV